MTRQVKEPSDPEPKSEPLSWDFFEPNPDLDAELDAAVTEEESSSDNITKEEEKAFYGCK